MFQLPPATIQFSHIIKIILSQLVHTLLAYTLHMLINTAFMHSTCLLHLALFLVVLYVMMTQTQACLRGLLWRSSMRRQCKTCYIMRTAQSTSFFLNVITCWRNGKILLAESLWGPCILTALVPSVSLGTKEIEYSKVDFLELPPPIWTYIIRRGYILSFCGNAALGVGT